MSKVYFTNFVSNKGEILKNIKMKHTAFTKIHESIGAKMVPFAGYYMPLQYEGLIVEHEHVRSKVGVFDVSHMGEVYVKGPKAYDLVQYITTNDVSALVDGKVQYSCMPNGKGGIVDDLLVYRMKEDFYLLVINAANIDKDWAWIQEQNKKIGADIENVSDTISQLAVQGPLALKAMQKLTDSSVEDMEYYTHKTIKFAGIDGVLFSTTGYTGSGGCEIYFYNENAEKIWNAVFEAGKEFDIKPIGLAARDTLRLEMGFCLYGNDIDDTTNPMEAGLGWITKLVDHNEFIDKDICVRMKQEGLSRKLVGFEMIDKGIPRHDYIIVDSVGNEIGKVTSGTQGPAVKKAIGMGYVKSEFSKVGSEIFIQIRDKKLRASIVKMPFYKG